MVAGAGRADYDKSGGAKGPSSRQGSGNGAQDDGKSGPRIRNDIGMSMKTQLRLVKAFKEMEQKSNSASKTLVRTGFRRKKATVQSGNDANAPEMLRDIWNQKETPPHFFLDGYNIIGYWSKLKKKRDKGDMLGAREALFDEVSQFAHFRGCQCTLVYDAAGNMYASPNTQAEMRREGVEVVFVRDESADSYLEARADELANMQPKDGVRPPRCYVATSDRNVQSISGNRGAIVMSSTLFIQEIKRAKNEAELCLSDMNKGSMAGQMVEDLIGAESVDALYSLMEQLEGRQIRARPPVVPDIKRPGT